MGTFVITKKSNSQYQFDLWAETGEVIFTSGGYATNSICRNSIEAIRGYSGIESTYTRKKTPDNKYYFIMRAGASDITGSSEMYDTADSRDKGIEVVKGNMKGAMVEDLS